MAELKDCNIEYTNQYGERFKLEIYELEESTDDYSMWLYLIPEDNKPEEVFSTWIDSGGGEVNGNQEVYKSNYDNEIDKAYKIFNSIMSNVYDTDRG